MKLSNIITFVKAGYTPAEISGITEPEAVTQLLNEGIKKEDIPSYLELLKDEAATPDAAPAEPVEPSAPVSDEDPTDYKQKYNTLLKQTQAAAARANMKPDDKSSDEVLADIVRSFM